MSCTATRATLIVGLGLALGSVQATAATSFELMPGAVVDPQRGAILVMQPDSGIAVLDAADGRELCTSRHAARPLLVQGSRVLAQTESGGRNLRLYVLDLSSTPGGGCSLVPRHEVKVALPQNVVPAIDERVDASFRVRAREDASGLVVVEWSFRESPAFPDSFAETGLVGVDLTTGVVNELPGKTTHPRPAARAFPPFPTTKPHEVRSGDELVSIEVVLQSDGTRAVSLGRARRMIKLDARDVRSLRLAADDRSLLVSSLAPSAPREQRYVWSIHALDSGEKRAEVRAAHSGSPFYLADSVVVYRRDGGAAALADKTSVARPVELVAREMAGDGEVVWTYRIRDTAYRGVRPPRQPSPVRGER